MTTKSEPTDEAKGSLIHIACRTCASDDAARRELGVEPHCHDVLTEVPTYAKEVVDRHEAAGHRVEWAVLRG